MTDALSRLFPERLLHRSIERFRGEVAVFLRDGAVGVAEDGLDVLHGHAPHG